MEEFNSSKCVLCKHEFTESAPSVQVHHKGLNTLIRISAERELEDLHNYLKETENVFVHHDCRRKFVDQRKRSTDGTFPSKKLRSSLDRTFNWKLHCFLCTEPVDLKHKDRDRVKNVMTLPLRSNMIGKARERGDSWGDTVLARLESCADLVAEEAIYHALCMTNFCIVRKETKKKGRPLDKDMATAFDKLCSWLEEESDCELYTIKELGQEMEKLVGHNRIYSEKSLREKLNDRYKEHIYFTELPGRVNVVCFRDMASYFLYQMKKKTQETKKDIITAAAKIIKAEIRELNKPTDTYPTIYDIENIEKNKEWVPESLQLLLTHIIPSTLKQVSIGQCITQAARPRSVMCPIVFGLGVQLEKSFASKWLLNQLYKLGYSISSSEVLRYKQSAIESITLEHVESSENNFYQWVADNVDHNLVTLTGKGTFHGMGVISISSTNTSNATAIKRLKERRKAEDFVRKRGIPIENYLATSYEGLLNLKFKPIDQLEIVESLSSEVSYNLLWQCNWLFSSSTSPRPNWSGFMQEITRSYSTQRKDSIKFLPIIDLNPSDENCIYSTLMYIIDQANKF